MLRLTENKVAIQIIPDPDTSRGGIIIPDIAKERADQGIVKYVGPMVKDVKIGDYVLFGGFDGAVVLMEGEGSLVIMRESVIKCIIEDIDGVVDGLYLKGKASFNISKEIFEYLYGRSNGTEDDKYLSRRRAEDIVKIIARYNSEAYFNPPFEVAIQLCADSSPRISHSNPHNVRENIEDVSEFIPTSVSDSE